MQFPVIITGIGIFLLLGIFGMVRQQWRAQKRKRFKKTQAEENLRRVLLKHVHGGERFVMPMSGQHIPPPVP